ncbi:hypothetical protein [Caniella muris]|uniref:hypothetical protein n=1 Tax=Caniella muris TaxID=2941502 RepID=UPI00203A95FE|nr:hypothetical protein [Caniella muris]
MAAGDSFEAVFAAMAGVPSDRVQQARTKCLGAIVAESCWGPGVPEVTTECSMAATATVVVDAARLSYDEGRHMRPWVVVTGRVASVAADADAGSPVLGYGVAVVDMGEKAPVCQVCVDLTDADLASLVAAGLHLRGSRLDLSGLRGASFEMPASVDVTQVSWEQERSVVFVDSIDLEDGWPVEGLGAFVTVRSPRGVEDA